MVKWLRAQLECLTDSDFRTSLLRTSHVTLDHFVNLSLLQLPRPDKRMSTSGGIMRVK